jgi:hypothetical protein
MGWPKIKFEDSEMTTRFNEVYRRLDDVENKQEIHDSKHDKCEENQRENHDYRRRTDSKLDGIYSVANEMLAIMKSYKEYEPSIIRTQNNFIAVDTIKKWAVWLTTVSAGLYVILDLKGIL